MITASPISIPFSESAATSCLISALVAAETVGMNGYPVVAGRDPDYA